MNIKILCLVLVFVNSVNFATAQLVAGDICQHKKTGTQGICKHAAKCDEAIQLIIRGLKPQRCGFDGLHLIVCCPGKPGGKEKGKDDKGEVKETVEGSENEIATRIVGQISKEGSICNHTKTDAQGVCKHAAECDEAIQLIIRGLKPQRCSLDGPKSIVCCPGKPGGKQKDKDEKEEVIVTPNGSENKTVTRMVGETPKDSSICNHTKTDAQGVCKHAAECDEATQPIIRGLKPQRCSLDEQKSTVCCPGKPEGKEKGKDEGEEVTVTANGSENKTVTRMVGEISKEKCRDYRQYIWTREPSPITLIDSDDIVRNECPYNATELIAGGTEASRKEFPHMVHIGYDTGRGKIGWFCGGSLISEQFVLTAAHCLEDKTKGKAKLARMGFIDQDDDDNVQQFDIVERIPHPDYKVIYSEYDIGLLKLNQKAYLNSWVRPACLYNKSFTPESKAIVSGWGHVGAENQSKILLKAVLDFAGPDRCHKFYKQSAKFRSTIDDNLIICAGSPEGDKDTCKGDSGGPLQVYNRENASTMNCMYDIVGVISYGFKCEDGLGVPATYTRVSHFVKWIEDIVWPLS